MMARREKPLRSRAWFDTPELYGWLRQAAFRAEGFGQPGYEGRPVIGICNSWSELTHCNAHLRQLAEAVKRGVWQASGFPLEFPVMSLGEYNMRPTTMLYRNLMSMDPPCSWARRAPTCRPSWSPAARSSRATGAARSWDRAPTAGATTRSCAPSA